MREVFLSETIPQKDWCQTPPPDGWDKVVCSRIKADNGLGIYIADARQKDDPRENDRNTTVILPPWADGTYHNPISQARAKVTAALENGLVIYVDNPGVELETPRMDRDVRWALCQGNFEPGAIEQWDAISQALDGAGLDFNAINRVIGYSLGAHVAAAIARTAPGEVYLDRLDLWEAAGLSEDYKNGLAGFCKFVGNFLQHGSDQCPEILQINPNWAAELREVDLKSTLAKLAIRRTAGMACYPIAINHHNIAETIVKAKDRKNPAIDGDTTVTVLNGTESLISPSSCNDRLAQRLAHAGLKIARFESEGGVHASQDNLGWWSSIQRQISQTISRLQAQP